MNKYTTDISGSLLRNQLGKAVIKLQSQASPTASNTDLVTMEQVLNEASRLMSRFYKSLGSPTFQPEQVYIDTVPELDDYNTAFGDIETDLDVVFSEFENLESVVLGNFNYLTTRLNRLNSRLKTVSSKLGDYVLYATTPLKDAIYFSDSFTNLSRVDAGSSLLNSDECEISQSEGIVLLPVDKSSQQKILISEVPIINTNSNGLAGNNYETGITSSHSNISDILDGNADTWFEYERVVNLDDGTPLILDFTVNLGDSKIVNFVRINPNNFGTRTQVEIVNIDTSTDGKTFISIKDDIPIADFTVEDEANVFTLAASTSKYAGQGLYSFTPRKAKYLRFSLKQSTAYVISTDTGSMFRYAIGIRDIEVQALPYKSKGEVISTAYSSSDEIKKVALLVNQSPDPTTTSKLASIKHYISPDDGVTWHEIRPLVSTGTEGTTQTVQEILDFNGVGTNSITTTSAVYTLRYKALLERITSAFSSDSSELASETESITELHSPPSTTPFEIQLQHTPIDGTLKLVDPNYGSRGIADYRYPIAIGDGNKLKIDLPFDIKYDYSKIWSLGVFGVSSPGWALVTEEPQSIFVGGNLWTNNLGSGSSSTDKHYRLDFYANTLEFGDGTIGKAVPDSSVISLVLQEERLHPDDSEDHIAQLDYATVSDKSQITIQLVKGITQKTVVLKPGQTHHELDEDIVNNVFYPITFSDTIVFTTQQNELSKVDSAGDWYVNYTTGELRSFTAVSSKGRTTVSYYYRPRTTLDEDDWDFYTMAGGVANAISISDDVYQSFNIPSDNPEVVTPDSYHISLANVAIVPGSVSFITSSGVIVSGVYQSEVPYIDGRTELLGVVGTREQITPITGITIPTNITKTFKLGISSDTLLAVGFSDTTVFQTEVVGTPTSVGEYSINRPARNFTVRVDSNWADPGYVSYYFVDPQADLIGRYSVDTEKGEVYFHDPTGAADYVTYEYTHYIAKYPIAREVDTTDWTHDKTTNKITIKDKEILKNMRVPQASSTSTTATKYYQVSYDRVKSSRDDLAELEPYFSPVLKDYALKIITASRMI